MPYHDKVGASSIQNECIINTVFTSVLSVCQIIFVNGSWLLQLFNDIYQGLTYKKFDLLIKFAVIKTDHIGQENVAKIHLSDWLFYLSHAFRQWNSYAEPCFCMFHCLLFAQNVVSDICLDIRYEIIS